MFCDRCNVIIGKPREDKNELLCDKCKTDMNKLANKMAEGMLPITAHPMFSNRKLYVQPVKGNSDDK